ncbi:hypothetical protein [uncultured Clostridium sp.]|uniref:hypothetical protein n=1 Tax=uncultured Clostridium sp. TaxID=59620 RepID=UPI002629F4E5|nr:hypothetical protein [uncultured Clostridium sp.]
MNDLVKTTTNNELLIRANNILENSYEVETKELQEVSIGLINTVKIKSLKRAVDGICKNLASCGEPTWYADAKDIAWDNQKRLTTIYRLLDVYEMLEKDIKIIKKNKNNCIENSDYLYSILLRIKELIELEQEFKKIKMKEVTDTMEFYQMLDELNNPQLNRGQELLEGE